MHGFILFTVQEKVGINKQKLIDIFSAEDSIEIETNNLNNSNETTKFTSSKNREMISHIGKKKIW